MARISTYIQDTSVTNTDKLIGSNEGGVTKNFTIESISNYFADINSSGVPVLFNWRLKNSGSPASGEFDQTGSNLSTFSTITSLKTNKYVYGDTTTSFENYFSILSGQHIIICQSDDPNNYGVFRVNSIAQDGSSNNYDWSLTNVHINNGTLTDGKIYTIGRYNTNSITSVTASSAGGTSTHTCDLSVNENFSLTIANEANTIALTVASKNIGQAGCIILNNPSSVGSCTYTSLPSYMKVPAGANVNFSVAANAVSVISYIVVATDKVLINYISEFA